MKTYLRRIRLNQGGYDSSGSYWGIGAPLYYWELTESPYTTNHFHADDREDAKEQILQLFPSATFYR